MSLVLASGSASRKALLSAAGISFIADPADLDEEALMQSLRPAGAEVMARTLAQEKALTVSELHPDTFPIQAAVLADLRGGDREANAQIIRTILNGKERGPKRDAVLLNAAAALFVAGRVKTMIEGWELGSKVIDSGAAWAKFEELRSV